MKLKNKRIIITGGTSGIGLEMVKILQPYNEIIVISKSEEKLKRLTMEFEGVITYQTDLSNISEVEKTCDAIKQRFESIDILINNAAIQNTPSFLSKDFDYSGIEKEITINFTSVCSLCYRLMPLLLNSQNATILNVNSGLGLTPKTSSAIYCGTKGALNLFSQSLRYQLEHTNIKVRQAFLDLVDTDMTRGRGKNKMSAESAANLIIRGIEHDVIDQDIGKVKFLRPMLSLMPWLAKSIMKKH